jgi:hypothetical protein
MVDVASAELVVAAGLELLDSSDALIEDISDDLDPFGSTVQRGNLKKIHGFCKLRIARDLVWSSQRLKPYLTLTDLDGASLRYDLGVYLPETPTRVAGESPQTFMVDGYDKLTILDTPRAASYEAASGAGVIATVETLLAGESHAIDQTEVGRTLPSQRVWPLDVKSTTLAIINDLLLSIGYRGLYADRLGTFRSEPWQSPTVKAPVYAYDTDLDTIVFDGMTEETDLFDVPNKWVFVRNDPAQALPTEGAGIYTVTNQSDGITSVDARGRIIVSVEKIDAADQASLVARGDRISEEDRQPTTALTFDSGPNPVHWHAEALTMTADELGLTAVAFSELSWVLPLNGDPMRHVCRKA